MDRKGQADPSSSWEGEIMKKTILFALGLGIFLVSLPEIILAQSSEGLSKPSRQELARPGAALLVGCRAFANTDQTSMSREETKKTAHSGFRQSLSLSSARFFVGIMIPLGIVISRKTAREKLSCRAEAGIRRFCSRIFPRVVLELSGSRREIASREKLILANSRR